MAQITLLTESVELIRQVKPILEVMRATKRSMCNRLERAGGEIQNLYDIYNIQLSDIQHNPHDKRDTNLLEGQVMDLKTAANSCLLNLDGLGRLDDAIEAIENIPVYPVALMDRFWCGTIDERNGEREYQHVLLYRDQTEDGAKDQHRHMTATFYPDAQRGDMEVTPDEDGAYNFGDVICFADNIWEISQLAYNDMKKGGLC